MTPRIGDSHHTIALELRLHRQAARTICGAFGHQRQERMFENEKPVPRLALKIGIAGFVAFGAIATGMFATRKGRHLVREAWQGRERTRIEDRVLDALWGDERLARRRIDVDEVDGRVELIGVVRTEEERERALDIAWDVKGVTEVVNLLEVVPRAPKRARDDGRQRRRADPAR